MKGLRATNPFKTIQVAAKVQEFHGKKHPTFFKFKGKDYGRELKRDCHIDQRSRIIFETDAANDYFSRAADAGEFALFLVAGDSRIPVSDYVGPNLQNGIATLTLALPGNSRVGDVLEFKAVVTDPTLIDSFENSFFLNVKAETVSSPGEPRERREPPSDEQGGQREVPAGISLPNIILVNEGEWLGHNPPFDKYTALRIGVSDITGNGNGENTETHDVYDFKINMDNLFLKSELKVAGEEVDMIRARWKYGLVLIGIALLHDDAQGKKQQNETEQSDEEENGESVEDRVENFTRAISPVLLPMIGSLGALELDDTIVATTSGEVT